MAQVLLQSLVFGTRHHAAALFARDRVSRGRVEMSMALRLDSGRHGASIRSSHVGRTLQPDRANPGGPVAPGPHR